MPDPLEPSNVISTLYDSGRYAELRDYCNMRLKKDPAEMLALENCADGVPTLGAVRGGAGAL